MGLNSNALITVKNLKIYLTIDKDAYNPLLERLINAVSQDLQNRLGRDLVYTSYSSVKLDGNGMTRLYLPAWPVWSISALTEDTDALTEDTDYFTRGTERDQGYLVRTSAGETDESDLTWDKGIKNITISYIAGYWVGEDPDVGTETELPDDIQMAVAMQVGVMWKRFKAEDWDLTSQTFPDGSIAKNVVEMHPLYKEIIKNYRRPVL
jgi:hypothetical protein